MGRLNATGWQRAAAGPAHQLIDVAIEVAVDRVCPASCEGPANHRRENHRQRRQGSRGNHHPTQGCYQKKNDNSGLREVNIGANRLAQSNRPIDRW